MPYWLTGEKRSGLSAWAWLLPAAASHAKASTWRVALTRGRRVIMAALVGSIEDPIDNVTYVSSKVMTKDSIAKRQKELAAKKLKKKAGNTAEDEWAFVETIAEKVRNMEVNDEKDPKQQKETDDTMEVE